MSKFWIIALDVYRKYVKNIGFVIMTLLPLFLIGSMIFLEQFVIASFGGDIREAAIIAEDETLSDSFQGAWHDETLRFYRAPSLSAAKRLLKDKSIKYYLTLEKKAGMLWGTAYTNLSLISIDTKRIQETLNTLQRELNGNGMGLSATDRARLNVPAQFESVHLDFSESDSGKESADYSVERQMVGMVLIGSIILLLSMYSGFVALEIASEKGTRVMEIMLSSTKAETHFYAKLTGVGLVCLTETAVYILIGIGIYPYLKNIEFLNKLFSMKFSDVFGGLFLLSLPIMLFTIVLYMIFAALSGSLVSKPEEVQYATQPVMYFDLAGYIVTMLFANDPQHIAMRIISYIPGWSAFAMPVRLARNGAALWEALLSLGLLIAADAVVLLFSARLYASNVLMYGDGGLLKTLKQSLVSLKAEKR